MMLTMINMILELLVETFELTVGVGIVGLNTNAGMEVPVSIDFEVGVSVVGTVSVCVTAATLLINNISPG
jgi:hypothetical protein